MEFDNLGSHPDRPFKGCTTVGRFFLLGTVGGAYDCELRVLCILGKRSTSHLHPPACLACSLASVNLSTPSDGNSNTSKICPGY